MFVSTLAQAAPSSYIQTGDSVSVQQVENSVAEQLNNAGIDSVSAVKDAEHSVKDDCPCKKHHGKMASIVCGVTLAFTGHQTVLGQTVATAVRFEWSSDDMLDAYISTLKRPPRFIL